MLKKTVNQAYLFFKHETNSMIIPKLSPLPVLAFWEYILLSPHIKSQEESIAYEDIWLKKE